MLLTVLVAATRAMHVEGFMDSSDALFGGFTRERRLEILRDPHIGSFAVAGGVCVLLLHWAGITAIPGGIRTEVLVLFPCLSRWSILVAQAAFPYARAQGMGSAFLRGRSRAQVVAGLVTAAAAAGLLAGAAGALLLVAATGVAWVMGRWMAGLLGGLTGDGYGAVNEVSAVAVLLLAIGIEAGAPALFQAPVGGSL